jgi:hypothetical protein
VYWPRSTAEPPSELRRQAYAEGHGLIGPDGDPKGWQKLDDIIIKGTLFEVKEVEVKYEVRHLFCSKPCQHLVDVLISFGSQLPSVTTFSSIGQP